MVVVVVPDPSHKKSSKCTKTEEVPPDHYLPVVKTHDQDLYYFLGGALDLYNITVVLFLTTIAPAWLLMDLSPWTKNILIINQGLHFTHDQDLDTWSIWYVWFDYALYAIQVRPYAPVMDLIDVTLHALI